MHFRNVWSCTLTSLFLGLLVAVTPVLAQSDRKVNKLAEGVYEIEHHGDNGNTMVIIGERQVFVVDTCLLPSVARQDIAQIRQWTDKPVSFVLNTHFHADHNFGNRIYMDAFPALTVIAHAETKRDMDMWMPSRARRQADGMAPLQKMLDTGKTKDGQSLTEDDKTEVRNMLAQEAKTISELKPINFQTATLTFDHDFTIDLGNREVQVKYLGRGNTPGDAVVYLRKEKIVAAGDLVVYPIPYVYDGYPVEWIQTLQNLAQLDAETIVPGHGPVMHDKNYVYLLHDLMRSAVDQMDAKLMQTQQAMDQNLDDVKGGVDLSAFRQRFAGTDQDLSAEFDAMTRHLIKLVFYEASLR